MDFVKNQIQKIQQQLAGLTASQRMLTAALVVIMVMTLLYWGRYAGTADMEPLVPQSLDSNAIGAITANLKGNKIPYEVQGDKVLVPSERKFEALAGVTYAKALPRNATISMEDPTAKLTPFSSVTERDIANNRVREAMCAQIISRFPNVEHAAVMITKDEQRSIGANNEPVATVEIERTDKEQEIDKKLVEAAAYVVKGAHSRLTPEHINVVVDGMHVRTPGGEGGSAGAEAALETIQGFEKYRAARIRDLFSYIPGVLVSVAFDSSASDIAEEQRIVDKNIPSAVTESRTQETETTSGGGGPPEPGAVTQTGKANEGMEVGGGGGDTQSSKTTDTTEKFHVDPSVTLRKTTTAAGAAKIISASMRVPRSYYWGILKARNPDSKFVPDENAVTALIDSALPKLRDSVRVAAGLSDINSVVVDAYEDALPRLATTGEAAVPKTASVPVMIGNHGKEIALGGLALVSLFMLMMMVRRSAPILAAPSAPAPPPGPPQPLVAGDAIAGEAGEGNPLLDGMELDEDAVKTQQMLDQVTTMVSDNPDAAASLVKRWLNRD
jgi:flagellar biosynthesis/type III secretory pathway M-ring protein FliF/YscJ